MANVKLVVQTDAAGTVAALREVNAQLEQTEKKAKGADQSLKGAFSKELEGRFQSLSSSTGGFGNILSSLGPQGLAAAAGIGAAAASAATLASWSQSLISASGALTDLSAKANISTTALQEYAYAGAMVGVSQEQIVQSITKAGQNIAQGGKEVEGAVKGMGLSIAELGAMKPEQQFRAIAEGIRGIQGPGQQAAAAVALFGRAGLELLPLIRSDFASLADEAHRVGAVLKESTVAAAEQVGDKLTTLSIQFDKLKQSIAAAIVEQPALREALTSLIGLLGDIIPYASDAAGAMVRLAQAVIAPLTLIKNLTGEVAAAAKLKEADAASVAFSKGIADAKALALQESVKLQEALAAAIKKGSEIEAAAAVKAAAAEKQRQAALEQATRAALEWQSALSKYTFDQDKYSTSLRQNSELGKELLAQITEGRAADALYYAIAENSAQARIAAAEREGELIQAGNGLWMQRGVLLQEQAAQRAQEEADRLEALEAQRQAWLDLYDTMGGLADLAGELGFDGLANALEDSAGWMEQFDAAAEDGVLSIGEMASLAAGLVNAFKKATDSASGLSRAVNTAILGASVGSKIGGIFGPVGAAIGAVAGGIIGAAVGFFHKPGWVKAGQEAGRVLGFAVSKELAKAIEKTAKELKIDFKSATLLHLPDAIKESGKEASAFTSQMGDLMKAIASGAVPAKEGMAALGESFDMLAEEASKAKWASLAMFDVMKQARATGVMTDGMKAAITAAVQAMGEALGKTGGLQLASEQAAINSATIFGLVWSQTVAEKGLIGAADALRPAFEALQKQLEESGYGEAAAAIFGPIQQQFTLANDAMFRGAAEAAQGYADILKSAVNTAMPITIDQFRAFGGVATDSFNQARDSALALGLTTEEAQTQALLAISPLLGQLVQAAAAYGFELDAGTMALIEQAKAAGVAFPTSPVDRMVGAVERLVAVLEKAFGVSTALGNSFDSFSAPEPGSGVPRDPHSYPGFASGGIMHAPASGGWAMLHGSEAVLTLPQLYGEMAGVVASRTAAMLAYTPTSFTSGGPAAGGDMRALLEEVVALRKAVEQQQVVIQNRFQVGDQVFAEKMTSLQRRGAVRGGQ